RHADREEELAVARARAPPGGEERPARVELLDAGVPRIRDVDVPVPVGRHAAHGDEREHAGRDLEIELSVARARAPPGGEEGASSIELLDAFVQRIRDADVPAPLGRHADREEELSVARARAPPGGEERPARVELLDAVVHQTG